MSIMKLPVLGTFFQNGVNVPGQTGYDALTPFAYHAPSACEVSIARFKLAVATSIVVTSGRAVVTCANHLMTILGQQVTFSGITGALAPLNGQTFTIDTITSSSVYSFPTTNADGTSAGSPVQEPVFTLPPGLSVVRLDANANVEYCSDNAYTSPQGNAATAPTWKVLAAGNATPVVQWVWSDGFSVRMRCSGTTATSYFNVVA